MTSVGNSDTPAENVICITSTISDMSVAGLRFCPDLDAAVQSLSPSATPEDGTTSILESLQAWRIAPNGHWPHLSDSHIAPAIGRTFDMARGATLSDTVRTQAAASNVTATVLPLTDTPVELHVIETRDGERAGRHVLRWINDEHRHVPDSLALAGLDRAAPAPGVLDAIRGSDLVVLLPMSPLLDAPGLLGLTGVRDALRGTTARVVAWSPTGLGSSRSRDVDDAAWAYAQLPATSASVARLYADFLDLLIVDDNDPNTDDPASPSTRRAPLAAAVSGDAAAMDSVLHLSATA